MNYVRGAFSAVTSYYTSLPPINASTLTGAIDVIVVERRDPDTDQVELACTPFHVRLGKWQVLRPGEKQVTAVVNGRPIPYLMKIGDAGEAFFVFETDEDVPEELMTSPVLGPTKIDDETTAKEEAEAQRQNASAGRFGAHDDASSSRQDSEDMLPTGAPPKSAESMNEPTFLDLDDGAPRSPTDSSHSPTREHTPVSDSRMPQPQDGPLEPEGESKSLLGKTKTALTAGPKLAASVLANAPSTAIDNFKQARDDISDEKKRAQGILRKDTTPVSEDAVQPPEVHYGQDVVMDMAGYHNSEAALLESSRESTPEPTSLPETSIPTTEGTSDPPITTESEQFNPAPHNSSSLPATPKEPESHSFPTGHSSPDLSSSSSVTTSKPLSLPEGKPSYIRGGSAPPDLQVSSAIDPPIGTSPPDYTWEWGAFPTRSPMVKSFPIKDDSALRNGPSKLGRLGEEDGHQDQEADVPPQHGGGGRLGPDPDDKATLWVTIEGKKFSFQLSLCGGQVKADVGGLNAFDEKKLEYERVFKDPTLCENADLVMKWGDKLITSDDSSPLLAALLLWRNNMKAPELSAASPPTSAPTSPTLAPAMNKRASGSSWARWWSRGRTEQTPPTVVQNPIEERPESPQATNSAPPEMERPESPPMGHAATAPAAIALPASRASSPSPETRKNYIKTLRLTSDQLKALDLKKGANTITFSLTATGVVACTAKIFVWDETDQVVVSDIDGTITKSDALGHMFNLIGRDWTHLGVAKLYTDISRNGYKMMYLTSRAIGQADSTRDYLKSIKQNNYQLPEGPVIMSPDRLMTSLHREVILRKPEVFKMACLRDIQRLFGSSNNKAFYAGFGNRITDALSYRSVNVPSSRIFTIDSTGEVKMELLELAGYKSSYIHMTDLVDQMFPPIHRKWATEYTDFNYWRDPVPEFALPDLDPPSPALSAVSDTSAGNRFSRLRNFSLRSATSGSNLAAAAVAQVARKETSPSPLQRFTVPDDRSTTLVDSASERDRSGERQSRTHERGRRSHRKLSTDSMPGSLPGSEYPSTSDEEELEEEDEEDGEEEVDDDDEDVDDEDEDEIPGFEDDIRVVGEMESVPF